ncbi:MAG: hypothetical protein V7647_169 [Acidobacteriota bacterium]|jgi:hypothetical protein
MPKTMVDFRLIAALLVTSSLAACSTPSPSAPSAPPVAVQDLGQRASADASGLYALSFNVWTGGSLQQVSSLVVGTQEMILMAHVTGSAGAPAQKGTAIFEYCSYKGVPPNDITRPDEAPKEACAQGTADWARLATVSVTAGTCPTLGTGYSCVDFGVVRIPRDVGFRFRYSPQGSGIAAGVSDAQNFTWVAGP